MGTHRPRICRDDNKLYRHHCARLSDCRGTRFLPALARPGYEAALLHWPPRQIESIWSRLSDLVESLVLPAAQKVLP